MDRVTALAIRLGVGLLVGIAVYLAVSYLLTLSVAPNLPEQGVAGEAKTPAEAVRPNGARLPEWLVTILSVLGLIVGGVLGYAAAGRLVRPRIAASQRTDKHALPALQGWSQVQSRLTTWFREAIRANLNSPSSAEDCRSTAKRFGIPEEELDQ